MVGEVRGFEEVGEPNLRPGGGSKGRRAIILLFFQDNSMRGTDNTHEVLADQQSSQGYGSRKLHVGDTALQRERK